MDNSYHLISLKSNFNQLDNLLNEPNDSGSSSGDFVLCFNTENGLFTSERKVSFSAWKTFWNRVSCGSWHADSFTKFYNNKVENRAAIKKFSTLLGGPNSLNEINMEGRILSKEDLEILSEESGKKKAEALPTVKAKEILNKYKDNRQLKADKALKAVFSILDKPENFLTYRDGLDRINVPLSQIENEEEKLIEHLMQKLNKGLNKKDKISSKSFKKIYKCGEGRLIEILNKTKGVLSDKKIGLEDKKKKIDELSKEYQLIFGGIRTFYLQLKPVLDGVKLKKLDPENKLHACSIRAHLQRTQTGWDKLSSEERNGRIELFVKQYNDSISFYEKFKDNDAGIYKLCKTKNTAMLEATDSKDTRPFEALMDSIYEIRDSQALIESIKLKQRNLSNDELIQWHNTLMARRGMSNSGADCCMNAPIAALQDSLIALSNKDFNGNEMIKSAMMIVGDEEIFCFNNKMIPFKELNDGQKKELLESPENEGIRLQKMVNRLDKYNNYLNKNKHKSFENELKRVENELKVLRNQFEKEPLKARAQLFLKELQPILIKMKGRFAPDRYKNELDGGSWKTWELNQDTDIRQGLVKLGYKWKLLDETFSVKDGKKTVRQDDAEVFNTFLLKLVQRSSFKTQTQVLKHGVDKLHGSDKESDKLGKVTESSSATPVIQVLVQSSKKDEKITLNEILLSETLNESELKDLFWVDTESEQKNDSRKTTGVKYQNYTEIPDLSTIHVKRFQLKYYDNNNLPIYDKNKNRVHGLFDPIKLNTGVYNSNEKQNQVVKTKELKARAIVFQEGDTMKSGHYWTAQFVPKLDAWITRDDNRVPRLLDISDEETLKDLEENMYLVEVSA